MASKKVKMLSSIAALGFSISMMYPCANVYAEGVTSVSATQSTKRLSGKDRYVTSVEVSKDGWKDGSEYVVIVSGQEFADALCAAPLAKKYNAPILLTSKASASKEVLGEVKRLNAKHAIIVGGEGAVSKAVASSVQKVNSSLKIERLSGSDRYATAVKVAEKIGTNKVVVATGSGYADALSISAIAAEKGMPVLLTEKNKLPQSVKNFIKGKDIAKAYIVGQTGAVSLNVEKEFKNVQRLGGQDRYETNKNILTVFANEINFKKVYMAVGGPGKADFADALAASPSAAKTSSPIILVNKTGNVATSIKELAAANLLPGTQVVTLGGEKVLSNEKVNSLKISAVSYGLDGETKGSSDSTKPENIKENISVLGNNVTFQNANVSKNVYVEGNKASLKNVKVDGTIYVHPGKDGISNLENVEAKTIKILSGAKESIHLKNVKADKIEVVSKEEVRVVVEGNTVIKEINVTSSSIVEAQSTASFGKVVISESTQENKTITLAGHIGEVIVEGAVKEVKLADGAIVDKIVAKVNVQIAAPKAQIKEIQAAKSVVVKPADASTKLPEIKPIDSTVPAPVPTPGETTGGGIVIPTPVEKSVLTKDITVKIHKDLADKNADQLFAIVKNKGALYNEIVNSFSEAYNQLSTQKESVKKDLNITNNNAMQLKRDTFGTLKIDVENKANIDIIREFVTLISKEDSLDKVREKLGLINKITIPEFTADGVEYKASKVAVMLDGKEVYTTGTADDAVAKVNGKINISYDELIGKVRTVIRPEGLKAATLNDLSKNPITISTEFKAENGKTKTVNYTIKLVVLEK